MKRYAVKVYYDGSNFYGFQLQKDKRTVAGELISALLKSRLVDDLKVASFQAASRTDRGVSALGQVVAFNTDKFFTLRRINTFLPWEVYVWAWAEVNLSFNPRRDAKERIYAYVLRCNGVKLEDILTLAKILESKVSFGGGCVGRYGNVSHKKLKSITVKVKDDFLFLIFTSKSFARSLIRRLVTLILMGSRGELSLSDIDSYLDNNIGVKSTIPPAPSENLILLDVKYDFKFNVDEDSLRFLKDRLLLYIYKGEMFKFALENL
ncbi:MAG: hypothetical protein ACKD6N_02650 [Candidatus Bathyarchaeota archaeon]